VRIQSALIAHRILENLFHLHKLIELNSNMAASDWVLGVTLSVLANVLGAAANLAVRKSWIIYEQLDNER
jgi:cytochrome bd-type quinol oxidase subunit 1